MWIGFEKPRWKLNHNSWMYPLAFPPTLANLFWREWSISKLHFYVKETQTSRKKEVEHCVVIASILKHIGWHDFKKSLAKTGHRKGKCVSFTTNIHLALAIPDLLCAVRASSPQRPALLDPRPGWSPSPDFFYLSSPHHFLLLLLHLLHLSSIFYLFIYSTDTSWAKKKS